MPKKIRSVISIYTKEDYMIAYSELLVILKELPTECVEKIPKSTIQMYEEYMDKNYIFKYDESLSLEEQKFSLLTYCLYANLYTDYLASEEEKEAILKKDREEYIRLEEEKKAKYSMDNLFPKKDTHVNSNTKNLPIVKKVSLLDKIKKILHLT